MKRKIYSKLLEWKNSSNGRSAIMIDGARRVGKSWIAAEFAKNEYDSYLNVPYVLHDKDIRKTDGRIYLPLYMAGILTR